MTRGSAVAERPRDALRLSVDNLQYLEHVVFLSRVSILTRDIDVANLSVCLSVHYVPLSDENGLTYRHSFLTVR